MRRVTYLIVLAGLLTLPVSLAHAVPTLQQRYLDIYLKINDAEHLEKNGDYRGALDDFQDCFNKLTRIHDSDPNWETALVTHRMADCQAKIADLTPKAAAQAPPAPPVAVAPAPAPSPDYNSPASNPPPSANPAPSPTAAPDSEEVASLKLQLQAVKQELEITKQKLSDSQTQLETYRVQLQTVNAQLAAVKNQQSVDDRMGKLLSDNKALTDKLAAAQKEIDTLKSNPKSKLAMAQAQLKNLQDQYQASQEANKALQDTTTTLKQQLDQAQADLVTANQKLAAAGTGSPEYDTLKRENEIMRDILTRELQEQAHRDMAKRLAQEEFDNLKLKSKVLQEQLDILGSPMTPPTNDQERALLASLKVPGPDVAAPTQPNGFSATVPGPGTASSTDQTATTTTPTTPSPATPDTNMASATPPPATDTNSASATPPATNSVATATPPTTTPDSTTNGAAVTIVMNTPPSTPDASSTNTTTPATPPAVAGTAATAPSTTPTTPPSTPAPDPNSPIPPNGTAPPPSSVTSTPPPSTPPTPADAPTTSKIPAAQTTYTDTTIQNGNSGSDASQPSDPTQYSTKARLPDDMRETAQDAADLFKNQKYDESAAKYQSIIDKYPESLYAWSNLGVVRFQQGKFDEALKALQQAVKLSPTDAFSYSNLGIVYYQLNQYENAIDALNSAKALDPTDAKTRNYLGCAESQKGWQEASEKEFRKAIELDPNFGDAHFNLALVYATSKPPSLELARREYNRALELGIAKDPRLEKLLGGSSPQP